MRAAIAGMEGRTSEAGAGFREAARQWRDLGLQFDLALCHLDLLATIGSGASGARAAADEARPHPDGAARGALPEAARDTRAAAGRTSAPLSALRAWSRQTRA